MTTALNIQRNCEWCRTECPSSLLGSGSLDSSPPTILLISGRRFFIDDVSKQLVASLYSRERWWPKMCHPLPHLQGFSVHVDNSSDSGIWLISIESSKPLWTEEPPIVDGHWTRCRDPGGRDRWERQLRLPGLKGSNYLNN